MSKQVVGVNMLIVGKTFLSMKDTLAYLSSANGVEDSLITDLIQQSTQNWLYYRLNLPAVTDPLENFPKSTVQVTDDRKHELICRHNYIFLIECRIMTIADNTGRVIIGLFPNFGPRFMGLDDLTSVDIFSIPVYLVVDPLGALFLTGQEDRQHYYELGETELEELFQVGSLEAGTALETSQAHRHVAWLERYRQLVLQHSHAIELLVNGVPTNVSIANVQTNPLMIYSRFLPACVFNNFIRYEAAESLCNYGSRIGLYNTDGSGPMSSQIRTANYLVSNFLDYARDRRNRRMRNIINDNLQSKTDAMNRVFNDQCAFETGYLPMYDIYYDLNETVDYYDYVEHSCSYFVDALNVEHYGYSALLEDYPEAGDVYPFNEQHALVNYYDINRAVFPIMYLNGPFRLGKPYDLHVFGRNNVDFRNIAKLVAYDSIWNYANDQIMVGDNVMDKTSSIVSAEVTNDASAGNTSTEETSENNS